jgi:hypothetical protein
MLVATNVKHHVQMMWYAYPVLLECTESRLRQKIAEMQELEIGLGLKK